MGIVHGDICPWNLLIDHETDSIKVFDFNGAAKLGWEGDKDHGYEFEYEENRNDVKFVIFTLYEIITREFCFREEFAPAELVASDVLEKEFWEKHPDVQLDSPVTEYRRVINDWVRQRETVNQEIGHFTKAAKSLNWPSMPDLPTTDPSGQHLPIPGVMLKSTLIILGTGFLEWQRPPTRDLPLPPGQRLFATGEVVGDDEDDSGAAQNP